MVVLADGSKTIENSGRLCFGTNRESSLQDYKVNKKANIRF